MEDLLLNYVKTHENWESELNAMGIITKHDENYCIFKYDMINCDFSNVLCKVSRGVILDVVNMKTVCRPFDKFFNYGETYADKLNWDTVRIRAKIDGSLMKMWYDNGIWHISTNGTIDAYKAELSSDLSEFRTYGDLFKSVLPVDIYDRLDPAYTYMFELVSPYNTVVIHYPETKIYHLGTRHNGTGAEIECDIGIEKPLEYKANSLSELIAMAEALPDDAEGYVAYDGDYRRVKVKNPTYVVLHHMAENRNFTTKRFVELIKAHEESEFLNYFSEFADTINEIKEKINAFAKRCDDLYAGYIVNYPAKKDFAIAFNGVLPHYEFAFVIKLYINPEVNLYNEILDLPTDKIISILETL